MTDSIKVVIRARPLIAREKDQAIRWQWTKNMLQQIDSPGTKTVGVPYVFDSVFGTDSSTEELYDETVSDIIDGCMDGFNGTIFAYGQTSSGKTHTMQGTPQDPGVMRMAIQQIFETIENTPDKMYLMRVSYMEIYNECVYDLLGDCKKALDIREDQQGNIYVAGLKEEFIKSVENAMDLLQQGEASRHIGSTAMNDRSSRSHTIFRVILEVTERSEENSDTRKSLDGAVRIAHLNLVDLAGSEKASQTGASGQRLQEGGYINKSLFHLSRIIHQLSDGASFINYRDAKLTRILQNALGGNSKTVIICNITPASVEESHSTLRFASRAKTIKNKPIMNEVLSDEALLRKYKRNIANLQKELEDLKKMKQTDELDSMAKKLAEKEKREAEMEEKLRKLTELFCVSSHSSEPSIVKETKLAKKIRRQTWCPGKARRSVLPVPSFPHAHHHSSISDTCSEPVKNKTLSSSGDVSARNTSMNSMPTLLEEESMPDAPDITMNMHDYSSVFGEGTSKKVHYDMGQEFQDVSFSSFPELQIPQTNKHEQELEDAVKVGEKLQQIVDELTTENEQLKNRVKTTENLQRQIEEMKEEKKHMEDNMEMLEAERAQWQEQFSLMRVHCNRLEKERHERSIDFHELEDFARIEKQYKDESILLKQSVTTPSPERASQREEELLQDMLHLEAAHQRKTMEVARLTEELNEFRKQEARHTEEPNESQASQEMMKETIEKLQTELTASQEKVQELEILLNDAERRAETAAKQASSEEKTLSEEVPDLNQKISFMEVSVLNETAALLGKGSDAENFELQAAQDRIKHLEALLEDQDGDETSGKALSEAQEKIERLQNLLAESHNQKDLVEAEYQQKVNDLNKEIEQLQKSADSQQSSMIDAVTSTDPDEELNQHKHRVEELEKGLSELAHKLQEAKEEALSWQKKCEKYPAAGMDAKELHVLKAQLSKEREEHSETHKKYEKLVSEKSVKDGRILSEINRDMDLQRRLDESEKSRREQIELFAKQNKESQTIIDNLNKKVYEIQCELQKASGEKEIAVQRLSKAEQQTEDLKRELRQMEDLRQKHDVASHHRELDPNKLLDQLKKKDFSLDLTKQRCAKYESQVKELEGTAKKVENITLERNQLQVELRETKHMMEQKHSEFTKVQQQYSASFKELAEAKFAADSMKSEVEKLRRRISELEKENADVKIQTDLSSQMDQLKLSQENLRTQCQNLELKVKEKQVDLENTQRILEDKVVEVYSLEEKLEHYSKEQQELKSTKAALQRLEEQHKQQSTQLQALQQQEQDWQAQCQAKEEELVEARSQISAETENQKTTIANLESLVQEKNGKLSELEKEMEEAAAMKQQLAAVQQEKALMEDVLEETQQRAEELQAQLQQLEKKLIIANKAGINTDEAIKELHSQNEELSNQLQAKVKQIQQYEQRIEEGTAYVKRLQEDIGVNKELEDQLQAAVDERENLQAELERLEDEIREFAEENSKVKQELEEMQGLVEQKDEQLELLTAQVEKFDKTMEVMEENVRAELIVTQEALTAEKEQLLQQLTDAKAQTEELKMKNMESSIELKAKEEQFEQQLKEQIEQIRDQAMQKLEEEKSQMGKTSDVQRLQEEHERAMEDMRNIIEGLKQQIDEKETEIIELGEQLQDASQLGEAKAAAMRQEHEARLADMQAIVSKCESTILDKDNEIVSLNNKVKELTEQIPDINKEQRRTAEQQVTDLKSELGEAQKLLLDRENELSDLRALQEQMASTHEAELEQRQQVLEKVQQELSEVNMKHACTLHEIENQWQEALEKRSRELLQLGQETLDEALKKAQEKHRVELATETSSLQEEIHQLKSKEEEQQMATQELEEDLKRLQETQEKLRAKYQALLDEAQAKPETAGEQDKTQNESNIGSSVDASHQEELRAVREKYKHMMNCLQETHNKEKRKLKDEIELMKQNGMTTQTEAERIEELQTEIKNLQWARETDVKENDRLGKMIDDMEAEIDQKEFERRRISEKYKRDVQQLQSKLEQERKKMPASAELEKSKEENSALQKELIQQRLRVNDLETQLMMVVDPFKKRVKALESHNTYLEKKNQELKNEIRKLRNSDSNESVCISRPLPHRGSKFDQDVRITTLESQVSNLEEENRLMEEEAKKWQAEKKKLKAEFNNTMDQMTRKVMHYEKILKKHPDRKVLAALNTDMPQVTEPPKDVRDFFEEGCISREKRLEKEDAQKVPECKQQ